jgi:hypothetical protein
MLPTMKWMNSMPHKTDGKSLTGFDKRKIKKKLEKIRRSAIVIVFPMRTPRYRITEYFGENEKN